MITEKLLTTSSGFKSAQYLFCAHLLREPKQENFRKKCRNMGGKRAKLSDGENLKYTNYNTLLVFGGGILRFDSGSEDVPGTFSLSYHLHAILYLL